MNLTDIASPEEWVALEERIHQKSGLDCNVFNPKGYRITDYKQWVNRLCPVIKDHDKGQSFICAVAHMNISGMAKAQRAPVIEECDAGLVKMVVPIFHDDEFLGAVGACGLLLDDGEVDDFMINKTIGLNEERIAELSDDIGSKTTDALNALAEFIQAEIRAMMQAK